MSQINVSTTFFPAALLPGTNGEKTDIVLYTSDSVFFYCHQSRLRSVSSNDFGGLLQHSLLANADASNDSQASASTPRPFSLDAESRPTIFVAEDSVVMNIMLLLLYDVPCERYGPNLDVIALALRNLAKYGIRPPERTHDIWTLLTRLAPTNPIRAYAIAAGSNVDSVCTLISQQTHPVPLKTVTEEDASTMGPLYLRRLFFLHIGRSNALRSIISQGVKGHRPVHPCTTQMQESLKEKWQVAAAGILAREELQDWQAAALVSTFGPLTGQTACPLCRENIQSRVSELVSDWMTVRRTI